MKAEVKAEMKAEMKAKLKANVKSLMKISMGSMLALFTIPVLPQAVGSAPSTTGTPGTPGTPGTSGTSGTAGTPGTASAAPGALAKPSALLNIPSGNAALEKNKASVLAFYDLMFNQSKPAEAIRLYVGATYIQHNPEVPDGKDAFIAFFEKMAVDYPGKKVEFKRVFADGAYVILHSDHFFPGWQGGHWAAMDIFRLDDQGKILEHWDVLQKVPASAAHSNGMF